MVMSNGTKVLNYCILFLLMCAMCFNKLSGIQLPCTK